MIRSTLGGTMKVTENNFETMKVIQEQAYHSLLYRYYRDEPKLSPMEKQFAQQLIQTDKNMPKNLYEAKIMLYKDFNCSQNRQLEDCVKYNQYDFSTEVGKKIACLEMTLATFVVKRLGYPTGLVPDAERDVVIQLISEGFLVKDRQLWKDYHEYQSVFGGGKSPAGHGHDMALKAQIYLGRKTNIRYEDVQKLVKKQIPYYFQVSRKNLVKVKK